MKRFLMSLAPWGALCRTRTFMDRRHLLSVALAALAAAGTGLAESSREMEVKLTGVSEIGLIGAKWRDPLDRPALDREISKLLGWHGAGLLVPVRVKVFDGHPLVKAIKKGPVLSLVPAGQPKVRLWVPVKRAEARVLVEQLESGRMELMDLPENGKLTLDFFQ